VLAAHHTGGIAKKAKSGRKAVLSSRARKRQEKSADRAEAIMDRTALKVTKSKGHAKVIESRKKTWDQVNKEAYERAEAAKLSKKQKAKMEEDAMVEAFYADEDGDAKMAGAEEGAEEPAGGAAAAEPAQSAAVPVQAAGEEEEIL
jgi:hypothetical protein